MNTPLFIVLFADNDIYCGKKTYEDCGWREIDNKPIKKIFFLLPTGDYMILADYDSYGRYTECTQIIAGNNAGKTQIEFIHVLGKRNGKIVEYKIHVLSGDVKVRLFDEENSYIKGLNTEIWKK